jgi:hypothetical protein
MRLVNSGSRMLIVGLPLLALGCSLNSNGTGAPSPTSTLTSGQSCSSGTTTVSGGSGDVQLKVCTTWTCMQGTGGSGSSIPIGVESAGVVTCTAPQNPGSPVPPGSYDCGSDEGGITCPPHGGGGGGASCVATETELTCTGGGGGSGGGGGGETGSECPPGTEGCPSGGEGGSSGGEGGSGGGSGGPCTLTQGYWKNHPDAWPVTSLTIGGVVYSQDDLLAIFAMDPGGDASLILAHQLIAAMLNQAAAVNPPAAVAQALSDAQAWMAANKDADGRLPYGTSPGSAAANDATALSSTLDSFNSGMAGVAHCQ